MGSIDLLKWRKAYMLEFLDGTEVVEVFTFSVPPESEEFIFPQRITETKTFGGSVFDDYGNDTYKITLSGSTINEDKKFIYRGLRPPLYLTGTKEIFELQKIIHNWADGKVAKGFFRNTPDGKASKRKIYLYDLSKMSVLQIASGTATRNYWRVFIKDLKIKRDKSKPKTYNYTLEMIGVEEKKDRAAGKLDSMAGAVDKIQGVMDNIASVMDLTEASTAALNQTATAVSHAMKSYERMKNRKNTTVAVMLGVGTRHDTVSRILGGDNNSFYNSTKNVLAACSTFIGIARGNSGTSSKSSTSQNTDVFTVRFATGDGSVIPTQHIKYSKTAEKPADPLYPKYRFSGWYKNSTYTEEYDFAAEVTANLTIYAKWILEVATITYNPKSGSQVIPQEVTVGEKTVPPTSPTRSGYIFDRWCIDYNCTIAFDFTTAITENITLYAAWKRTCNVVFNAGGGSEVATQTVVVGALAVYPMTPKKENYTFAYWCTDRSLTTVYDFLTPVTKDTTLYACYVQVANTVFFNSMGGSTVEQQRVPIGGHAAEPEKPVKKGFDFVYWATDQAGTNQFHFTTAAINANITLYAKWAESHYTVSFDTAGGSAVAAQTVSYGKKAVFPDIPKKDKCVFEMWRIKTVDHYNEFDFSTPITEDVTLYALWFGGT